MKKFLNAPDESIGVCAGFRVLVNAKITITTIDNQERYEEGNKGNGGDYQLFFWLESKWQILGSDEHSLPSLLRFPLELQEVLESGELVKEIDVLEMTS